MNTMKTLPPIHPRKTAPKLTTSGKSASHETQGQIVGTRESPNGPHYLPLGLRGWEIGFVTSQ